MPIPVPTRTAGSLGTAKSNAQPLTNEPQQLSAPQYNVCADNLIAAINLANANEAAIAGAGGGLANYGTYLYDASSTSGAGIAAGDMRFSGANPSTSGLMFIHKTNVQGFDLTGVLDQVRSWRVSFISTDGTEMLTVLVSQVFDGGTHYIFQLQQQSGSAAFTDNAAFTVSSIAPAPFEIPQGGTYALGNWDWLGATTVADPGAGNMNMSSSSPSSAVALYVNVANASNGVDFIEPFQDLQAGDFILLRSDSDAYGVRYVVTGAPVDNTTWFNIPVAVQSAGGSIGSNQTMRMVILKSTAAAVAASDGIIETQTKADSLSGIFTFNLSAIPLDYDLMFTWQVADQIGAVDNFVFTFNGDSAPANTNYKQGNLRVASAGGTALPGNNGVNQDFISAGLLNPRLAGGSTVNDWGYGSMRIPFNWKTTGITSAIGESWCNNAGAIDSARSWIGGSWKTAVAVTQIDFATSGGNLFTVGSTITLRAKPKGTL